MKHNFWILTLVLSSLGSALSDAAFAADDKAAAKPAAPVKEAAAPAPAKEAATPAAAPVKEAAPAVAAPAPAEVAPAEEADPNFDVTNAPAVVMGSDGVPVSVPNDAANGPQPVLMNSAPATPAPEQADPDTADPDTAADEQVEDTDESALRDFGPHLNPYGTWVDDPTYGMIWVPHRSAVGTRFAPYVTRGHWSLTRDNQWIWVSDYPFGGIVFHYGRWVWANSYGWSWIPGRRYSHAWVTFRVSNDPFIGWAPMPPTYVWRRGVAVSLGFLPPAAFVFAPIDYAFYPSVASYVIYEPFRVHRLMARSYYYAPPVRRYGVYYSPPVTRIPPQARPRGRMPPNAQAMGFRQTRPIGQRELGSPTRFQGSNTLQSRPGGGPGPRGQVFRPASGQPQRYFQPGTQGGPVQRGVVPGGGARPGPQQLGRPVRPAPINGNYDGPRNGGPGPRVGPQRMDGPRAWSGADSRRVEPRRMEPRRVDPRQEPRRIEPRRVEPRSEPRRMEPRRVEPRSEPRRMEPRRVEPRQEPRRVEPRRVEPRRVERRMERPAPRMERRAPPRMERAPMRSPGAPSRGRPGGGGGGRPPGRH